MSLTERISLLNQSNLDNNKENIEDFAFSRNNTTDIFDAGSPDQSSRRSLIIRQLKDQFEQQELERHAKSSRMSVVRQYSIEKKLVSQAKKQIELHAEKHKLVVTPPSPRSPKTVEDKVTPPPTIHHRFFGPMKSSEWNLSIPLNNSKETVVSSVDVVFARIYSTLTLKDTSNVEEKFEKLFQCISQRLIGMTLLFFLHPYIIIRYPALSVWLVHRLVAVSSPLLCSVGYLAVWDVVVLLGMKLGL